MDVSMNCNTSITSSLDDYDVDALFDNEDRITLAEYPISTTLLLTLIKESKPLLYNPSLKVTSALFFARVGREFLLREPPDIEKAHSAIESAFYERPTDPNEVCELLINRIFVHLLMDELHLVKLYYDKAWLIKPEHPVITQLKDSLHFDL